MSCSTRFSRAVVVRAVLLLGTAVPCATLFVQPVQAQDYTNIAASGRVIGEDGAPIANAEVKITSSDRGISRVAATNESGAYTIPQLAPGNYDFAVTAPGFAPYSEKNIALTRGTGGANSFTLAPPAGASDIVVTGRRQRVADFQDTTTGAVIDLASLQTRVPIGRTLRDVMLLTPGAVQGSSGANGGFSNQVSLAGASFTENAFYINGLNVTDFVSGLQPTEVPFDFYQTVEVKTGGAPAEFGRATGGYVVATTKSGSNDYHASITGTWEPNDLRGSSPNTYRTNNRDSTASRQELVFQGSGPIIKDHLFVYGLYNLRNIRSMTPASDQNNATGVTNTSPFWGGKIDGYISGAHHFEFTYFDTTNDTHTRSYAYDRATNTLGAKTGGTDSRAGGINYVGRYTGTFTPWLTMSAAYGVNKLRSGNVPLDTVNSRVLDYRTNSAGTDIGLNKVTDAYSHTDDERQFYRVDADLQFKLLGAHHVRIGYDHERDTQTQTYETIGSGFYKIFTAAAGATNYGVPIGTDYYTTRVYSQNGVGTVRNQALYLQDEWSLLNDRLRLQLGVRDDRFSNQGVSGKSFYNSGDQWAPRLGASYDVFGDGKTKAFGYFGKYYLPLAGDINLNVAGQLLTYTRYNLLNGLSATGNVPNAGTPILNASFTACPDTKIANCIVTATGQASSPAGQIAANLTAQSDNELIFGATRQISDHIRIGASFTHRELTNVIDDVSVDMGERAYCATKGFSAAACLAAYPGGRHFVIANPGKDITTQINALPDGTTPVATLKAGDLGYPKPSRHYNALTLTFDRSFDKVWSLSASYTWAIDKGNYEGGVRSENGQLAVNRSADFDTPAFTNGAYGYLPNDRRHTIKAYGSYRPFDFLDLGSNLVLQSPQHNSCIGTVPASIDAAANGYHGYSYYCNGTLVPRGTAFDGQWLTQLDVSAIVHLPVPKQFDASLRLDVFNLLNTKSVTAYDQAGQLSNDAANPNYQKPLAYQSPLYARLQFRLGF
ncbi:TonB-dependent receptor [Sphingomonas glacialis]|uniref:TonB-dependent receptor n=1 Tax=Sphingomonas glacialis TaxID=658225 RepID=A0A502FFT8_9SPHN|nr:TonB-dependent receptor [Sphingomonas glacialis]TPG48317.1 TonB-dependent receptor [Sphingomonas glacialis]